MTTIRRPMTISCRKRTEPAYRRGQIATVAWGLFAILLPMASAHAEPYRPSNPDTVLVRLTGEASKAFDAVRTPEVTLAHVQREMSNGRQTLDERHFGRARALLASALPCVSRDGSRLYFDRCGGDAASVALLIAYADVLQHAHEFENAQRALDRVLTIDPTREQARVLRASIRLARGNPRDALQDCGALIGADSLVATACIAQSIGLNGRLREAHRLLSTELSRADTQDERAAWALGILGEMAERLGRNDEAVAALERAMSADPNDAALRIQAADLMLRLDVPKRAMQALEPLPPVEAVLMRRAIAAKRMGVPNGQASIDAWRASVAQNTRLKRPTHFRDAAIAELELNDRPSEALRHALANWNESKEVADARLLIVVAIAAGRIDAATPALRWVDELALEDAAIARARSST